MCSSREMTHSELMDYMGKQGKRLVVACGKKCSVDQFVLVSAVDIAEHTFADQTAHLVELEKALQSELDNPTYHICTRANEATKQALMVSGRGILPPDDCPRCHWLERARKALQQTIDEENER